MSAVRRAWAWFTPRRLAAIAALAMFATVIGLLAVVRDIRRTDQAVAAAEVQLEVVVRGNRRQSLIADHASCLRLNDGRRRIRAFNGETIRITFERLTAPDRDVEPETKALLDAIALEVAAKGLVVLPAVDCDTAAPLPPDITAAERARLPRPEPIRGLPAD